MATAVLRPHDPLKNRMHMDAFASSPPKSHRRRHPRPAAATTPPPKPVAQSRRSPPARSSRKPASPAKEKPKPRLVMEEVRILKRGEEPPATAPVPSSTIAAEQAEPDNRRVCFSSRLGSPEPPVLPTKVAVRSEPVVHAGSAVVPTKAAVRSEPVVRAGAAVVPTKAAVRSEPVVRAGAAVVPTKAAVRSDTVVYAGPAFCSASPEPSSLPFPAFFLRRAETEATRGLRCLLRIGEL